MVPAIHPKPISALPLRMRDAAIFDIQYLDVDQGMNSSFVHSILEDSRGNLPKPFHKEELLARINTQLNLHCIFTVAGRFVPKNDLWSRRADCVQSLKFSKYLP